MELTKETQKDLINEINSDGQRIIEATQRMWKPYNPGNQEPEFTQQHLEQIVYITEQIRLKLKLLGAPRMWN